MDFMGAFKRLLGGREQQQPTPANQPPIAQPQRAPLSEPDITYNPNPARSIRYSARSPELAQMGNRYVANPHSPEFTGIDPKLFGFPADETATLPVRRNHNGTQAFDSTLPLDNMPQGGIYNPGFTPLQRQTGLNKVQPSRYMW